MDGEELEEEHRVEVEDVRKRRKGEDSEDEEAVKNTTTESEEETKSIRVKFAAGWTLCLCLAADYECFARVGGNSRLSCQPSGPASSLYCTK